MLQELKDIFAYNLQEKGDAIITDMYTLSPGTYLLIGQDASLKRYEITYSWDRNDEIYRYLAERDRLSILLAMNKPIDPKKVIHSNQVYAFFAKKDSLSEKLTDSVLDTYYSILLDPREKYKDKKKRELYEQIEGEYGGLQSEEVMKIKQTVKEILTEFKEKEKLDKTYLKIFFDVPLEWYRQEQEKYVIPNIYNTNEHNVVIEGITFGVPNNNFGMNAKKPYLENKSRKNLIPVLLDSQGVLLQHNLFEFLSAQAAAGYRNVYFDEETKEIRALKETELPLRMENGYYVRLNKGIEVEIQDFDTFTAYPTGDIRFIWENFLNVNFRENDFDSQYGVPGMITDLKSLQERINRVFFQNHLIPNYFSEPSDIRIFEPKLKETLLRYRKAFHSWFYKGKSQLIQAGLPDCARQLVENSILQDNLFRARHQYNLYLSLQKYFSMGGMEMPDHYKHYIDEVHQKILTKETAAFEEDTEFYIAAGQAAFYLLSQSRGNKPPTGMKKALLRALTPKKLKAELLKLYERYFHAIDENYNRRFNQLMAMIAGYQPESMKVDREALLYGYLHSNILYISVKGNKQLEEETEGGMGNER